MTEEKTNSKMQACKACKKEVSIKDKACPHCNIKNPTITTKDQVISAIVVLLIISSLSYCVSQPEEKGTDKGNKTSQSEPAEKTFDSIKIAEPFATIEELQTAYDLSQKRAIIIRTIWLLVEPEIAVPNQTQITQYLLDGKEKCKNLSYVLYKEQAPNTDKELTDLFDKMNESLSFAAGAIKDRINYAIELSSGTRKPVKAAEKFSHAKRWYESEMVVFEGAAQAIAEKLKERGIDSNKNEELDTPSFIDTGNLIIGKTYIVPKKTPIMPYHTPDEDFEYIKKIKYLMLGGALTVTAHYDKESTRWYEVTVTDTQTRQITKGWVNSMALLGQQLQLK